LIESVGECGEGIVLTMGETAFKGGCESGNELGDVVFGRWHLVAASFSRALSWDMR
jgi:hypothetical protein